MFCSVVPLPRAMSGSPPIRGTTLLVSAFDTFLPLAFADTLSHSRLMRWSLLLLLLLLASCGSGDHASNNRVILPGIDATELLKQCSRDAPAMGEKAWVPTDAEVDALEKALPAALAASSQGRKVNFSALLEKWQRQYVGIIRGGTRYIYGNYFPAEMHGDILEWRKAPLVACDGGPKFFGAEFNVSSGRVTRLDFNGTIGGPS